MILDLQYITDNSLNAALLAAVIATPTDVEKQIASIEKLLSFLCVDRFLYLWEDPCACLCSCGCIEDPVVYPDDIKDLIMYILEQKYYTVIPPSCAVCYDPNVESMSMPWWFSITYKDDRFPSYYRVIGWINVPSDYYLTMQKYDCKNLLIMWNVNV